MGDSETPLIVVRLPSWWVLVVLVVVGDFLLLLLRRISGLLNEGELMAAEGVYELEVCVNSFTIDDVDGTESLLRVEALRRQCTASGSSQPVVATVAALLPFSCYASNDLSLSLFLLLLLLLLQLFLHSLIILGLSLAVSISITIAISTSISITISTAAATAAVHLLDRLQLPASQCGGAVAIAEIRLEILAELLLLRNALNARAGEFSHIRWLQLVGPLPDLAQADGGVEAIEYGQWHRDMGDNGPCPEAIEVQLYGM